MGTLKGALLNCLAGMLLTLLVHAQPAAAPAPAPAAGPAVDRKDPVAVAKAYVKACQAGDIEGVVALLGPNEALKAAIRQMAAGMRGGPPGMSFEQMLMEMRFMPMQMGGETVQVDAKVEDKGAVVGFRVNSGFDQKIILAKQADATWAVQLVESIKATTKNHTSFLEMELTSMAGGGGGGEARQAMPGGLYKLAQAMQQYAAEHEGKLPPAQLWMDEIELYVLDRHAFRSEAAPDKPYGYAMYAEAGGAKMIGGQEERFLILVEAPGDLRNAVVTKDDLPKLKPVRPDGSIEYALANGEVGTLAKGVSWETVLAPPLPAARPGPEMDQSMFICQDNLRRLVDAARKYARKHGGVLPKADDWEAELQPYLDPGGRGQQNPFICPAAPEIKHPYAINAAIAGKNALDLANQDQLVLFFESKLNVPNAAGDPERDAADPPRHTTPGGGGACNCVGYLGGMGGQMAVPPPPPPAPVPAPAK